MAKLPTPCEVLETPSIWVPLVVVGPDKNVFILPGIPRLFQQMLEANEDAFRGSSTLRFHQEILTSLGEGEFADDVRALVEEFPTVQIGSYPNTDFDMRKCTEEDGVNRADDLPYRVKLVLRSDNLQALASAKDALCDKLVNKSSQRCAGSFLKCSEPVSNDSRRWRRNEGGEWVCDTS